MDAVIVYQNGRKIQGNLWLRNCEFVADLRMLYILLWIHAEFCMNQISKQESFVTHTALNSSLDNMWLLFVYDFVKIFIYEDLRKKKKCFETKGNYITGFSRKKITMRNQKVDKRKLVFAHEYHNFLSQRLTTWNVVQNKFNLTRNTTGFCRRKHTAESPVQTLWK